MVAPSEKPTAITTKPTIIGPKPAATLLGPMAITVITKTAVPKASPKRFDQVWRMAGPVEKQAKIVPASLVSFVGSNASRELRLQALLQEIEPQDKSLPETMAMSQWLP